MQITVADFRRKIDGKRLALMGADFIHTPERFAVFQELADNWEKRSIEMDKNVPINVGVAKVRAKDFYRTLDDTKEMSYATIPAGAKAYYAKAGKESPEYLLLLSPNGIIIYRTEL